jgi:hypothetical protein
MIALYSHEQIPFFAVFRMCGEAPCSFTGGGTFLATIMFVAHLGHGEATRGMQLRQPSSLGIGF